MIITLFLLILQSIPVQQASISFNTEFVLEDTYSNEEPMGVILNVESFSDGSFVVHEYRNRSLTVLNADGSFQKMIGRSGRGPGEFLEIHHIFVDRDDRLLITERPQMKITVIEPDGEVEDYFTFKNQPTVKGVLQDSDGKLLFNSSNYPRSGPELTPEKFYFFDEEFELLTPGFIPPSLLVDEDTHEVEEFVIKILTSSFNALLKDNNDLILVSEFYDGTFKIFSKNSGYSEFKKLKSGHYEPTLLEYKSKKPLTEDMVNELGLRLVSSSNGSKAFMHLNRSMGLFKLNDGNFIHFSQITENKKSYLLAEVFDADFTCLLGSQKIERLGDIRVNRSKSKYEDFEYIHLNFVHLDHQNRLFTARNNQDVPELHIIKLNVDYK